MRAALVVLLAGLLACGGAEPPPKDRFEILACPDGTRVHDLAACPALAAAPDPPAVPEPTPSARPPPPPPTGPGLPPPKPTTISLRTGEPKLDAALEAGDKAFEDGDLAKAQSAYEAARKEFPKRSAPAVGVLRVKIARLVPGLGFAAAANKPEVAALVKELKRAADAEPSYGPAQVELGRALLLVGDAPQAEAVLRKGARLMPEEPEARSALGVALLATGKVDEAAAELTKARDLDPGSAARRGNLGTVLFMRGKVAEAIKEYEVQVQLAPDDPRARSDLGTALLAQSDFTRAIPALKKAIELDPQRATFRSNLGYALQLQGKISDAIAEYREAIRLDPKLASAWINLATALARDPKTRGEARQALKTAEKLDPSDPRVKANLEELDALEKQSAPEQ